MRHMIWPSSQGSCLDVIFFTTDQTNGITSPRRIYKRFRSYWSIFWLLFKNLYLHIYRRTDILSISKILKWGILTTEIIIKKCQRQRCQRTDDSSESNNWEEISWELLGKYTCSMENKSSCDQTNSLNQSYLHHFPTWK